MAELPTIAIVSWKRPGERWIINASDFDPKRHVRWEDREQHIKPIPAAFGPTLTVTDELIESAKLPTTDDVPARRRGRGAR